MISREPIMEDASATTIISEEIDNFSENYTEVFQKPIVMRLTFEERLSIVQVRSDKEPTSETETEQVIEEVTTKPQRKTQQSSLITETTTQKIVTTTTETTTEELVDEPTEEVSEETTTEVEETTTESSGYVYSEKYPTAATIWNYLKDLGYSNAVCAGIMGNIMAEVGGHTLHIQPYLNDTGGAYYGICQWSTYYYPQVQGMSLSQQLDLLASTIRSEINTFGYKYYSGFNYSAFLSITDAGVAAKAFAVCYERCASWTYSVRVSNAYKAYDYFT